MIIILLKFFLFMDVIWRWELRIIVFFFNKIFFDFENILGEMLR